jgi:hypothetical protein
VTSFPGTGVVAVEVVAVHIAEGEGIERRWEEDLDAAAAAAEPGINGYGVLFVCSNWVV